MRNSFKLTIFIILATIILTHTVSISLPFSTIKSFITQHKLILCSLSWCTFISIITYFITQPRPVYLLDYSCHKPDSDRRCSLEICENFGLRSCRFSDESEAFMRAIYRKSGLGDETYGPPYIFQTDYDARIRLANQEAEEGMFASVESLLNKTGINPSTITVLITGCSMYSPSPSLTSMLVHRFNFSPSIKTYNLSGMGCSAGTMSFDLATKILRQKIGYVLVVVTENMSLNWYFGDNRHMLVTNCIFRCGTAAALLTNDPLQRHNAKMELVRTLRTHHGADNDAYNAAIQMDDDKGEVGVALTKDLVIVAGTALKKHITQLAPTVLPLSELIKYALNVILRSSIPSRTKSPSPVPDFTKAFEHICIHAGGKAVIDAISRLMNFDADVVEPARMCLHRFGNTSSSLVFYELAYFEAQGRIKIGDRVWMLAFGTGFKACSAVWRALKDSTMDSDNPWRDCIHRYPI